MCSFACPTTPVQQIAVLVQYLFLSTEKHCSKANKVGQSDVGYIVYKGDSSTVPNYSLFCIICSSHVEVCHYSLFKKTIVHKCLLTFYFCFHKKNLEYEIVWVIFSFFSLSSALSRWMVSMVCNPD